MRFLADLSEDDVRWLDQRARALGKSRAAVLRDAVTVYRAEGSKDWIDQAFGIWKERDDLVDAVELQRRQRAEWTRPWDPDYGEVRAEFPDLFTQDDDRERDLYRR